MINKRKLFKKMYNIKELCDTIFFLKQFNTSPKNYDGDMKSPIFLLIFLDTL